MFELDLSYKFPIEKLPKEFDGACISVKITPEDHIPNIILPESVNSKIFLKKIILDVTLTNFSRANIPSKITQLRKNYDIISIFALPSQLMTISKYNFDLIEFDFDEILHFKQKELNDILRTKYMEIKLKQSNTLNFMRNLKKINGFVNKERVLFSSGANILNELKSIDEINCIVKCFGFKKNTKVDDFLKETAKKNFIINGVVVEDGKTNIYKELFVLKELRDKFK